MECYFCKSLNHSSENCDVYSTLQNRYSKVGYCRKYCLCKNFVPNESKDCKCKIICDVCLQQHHAAFCPKKDPSHSSFIKINDKDSIKLDMTIWRRLLDLFNPINKIKLQLTCKSLFSLQQGKFDYKLRKTFDLRSLKPNIIYNGHAILNGDRRVSLVEAFAGHAVSSKKDDIVFLEEKRNIIFNLQSIYLNYRNITAMDLKILSRSDPLSIELCNCQLENDISFLRFVSAFPYCIDFSFSEMILPKYWIRDLSIAKRKVEIKRLNVKCNTYKIDYNNDSYYEYFIKLFQQNKDLKFTYIIENGKNVFEHILHVLKQLGPVCRSDEKNGNLIFKSCSFVTEFNEVHYLKFYAKNAKIVPIDWSKLKGGEFDQNNSIFPSLFRKRKLSQENPFESNKK